MPDDVDLFLIQFSLVQGLVDPMEVLRGVVEVEEQPKVEVVADVGVDGNQAQAWPQKGLKSSASAYIKFF